MKLVVKPITAEVNYYLSFKEPLFSLSEQETKLTLIKKILGDFGLRLNDIKFNDQSPSNNYIHFYKFIGQCFLDVSLGLEEMTAKIGAPFNEEQVVELSGKLFQVAQTYT